MAVLYWYLGKSDWWYTCTVAYTEKVPLYKVPVELPCLTGHPVHKVFNAIMWTG